MSSITRRMIARITTRLVRNSNYQSRLVSRDETSAEIEFMGALRIQIRIRRGGEKFSISLDPIRGKCLPNHIWAAEEAVDAAVLAAAKATFGLAYTGTSHR